MGRSGDAPFRESGNTQHMTSANSGVRDDAATFRETSGMEVANGGASSHLVLGYHAISETWPASLSVTPARFRQQLEALLDRGYRGSTLQEVIRGDSSSRMFAVTFDDAYLSVMELGFPILTSLGIPATVFVVTDFADHGRALKWPGIEHWRGGEHEQELRGLGWLELAELAEAGWEIGSHTRTHPRLTRCSSSELERELRESREACERALARPCESLAYPFGDADARVMAAAEAAGYSAAVVDDVTRPRPLAWPRVAVYHENSMLSFRIKVSPIFVRARAAFSLAERRLSRGIRAHG
jgi:peptidoglycan/xylan/chitin deacetylase (PgdA/CDA1 family)